MNMLFRYLLSLTLVGAALLANVRAQSPALLTKLQQREFHVAAHRGAHMDYPENSMESLKEAINLGASIVEVDVRATKDGILLLMHDNTVDRTTTGKGKISELTYAEVKALYLREQPHGKASVHHVPTLEEALSVCKGKIIVDLDFKEENEAYVQPTLELVQKMGMEDEVLFFLYDYKDMERVSRINPAITMFPRARSMKDVAKIVKTQRTQIIHIDASFQDKAALMPLRAQGIFFWINTLGEVDEKAELAGEAAYRDFLAAYPFVRIIQTDNPKLWNQTLITYKKQ